VKQVAKIALLIMLMALSISTIPIRARPPIETPTPPFLFLDAVWSSDSTKIAIACDLGVLLYDSNQGNEQLRTLGSDQGIAQKVAFNPDGTLLASAFYEDGSITVWNLTDYAPIARLKNTISWVTTLGFTDDGNRLIAGTAWGDIHVWEINASSG